MTFDLSHAPGVCTSSSDTCEEAAVVLLYLLRKLKLLLGMFLGEFLPQVLRVLLFSEETSECVSNFYTFIEERKLLREKINTSFIGFHEIKRKTTD